jgi:DNA-binding Lrp family transcriptional regulator
MKDVEFRLLSELMRNSRRSDRDIAKAIGVSQPTVSRIIKKLEKEGYIEEYTMTSNFHKLGYEILALTFVKLRAGLTPEEIEKARKVTHEDMKEAPAEIILFERGIGEKHGGVIISFHQDYSSYTRLRRRTGEYQFVDSSETEGFLVNLNDEVHYRPLTFRTIAQHILTFAKKEETASV